MGLCFLMDIIKKFNYLNKLLWRKNSLIIDTFIHIKIFQKKLISEFQLKNMFNTSLLKELKI